MTSDADANRGLAILRNKWLQVGIAGIPYVGGPIQTYISQTLSKIDEKIWDAYWLGVDSRLQVLSEKKVDYTFFTSDEFASRIRAIYRELTGRLDDQKAIELQRYLVACAVRKDCDINWRDIFFQYLTKMTGVHSTVLHTFYAKQSHFSEVDRFQLPSRIPGECPLLIADVLKILDHLDATLLELVVADLQALGLVHIWLGKPAEPKGWCITNSGIRFLQFLKSSEGG